MSDSFLLHPPESPSLSAAEHTKKGRTEAEEQADGSKVNLPDRREASEHKANKQEQERKPEQEPQGHARGSTPLRRKRNDR